MRQDREAKRTRRQVALENRKKQLKTLRGFQPLNEENLARFAEFAPLDENYTPEYLLERKIACAEHDIKVLTAKV